MALMRLSHGTPAVESCRTSYLTYPYVLQEDILVLEPCAEGVLLHSCHSIHEHTRHSSQAEVFLSRYMFLRTCVSVDTHVASVK